MKPSALRVAAASLAGAAAVFALGIGGAPTAAAATASAPEPATSACRPANYQGTVTDDGIATGYQHYRVTLVAAPGTLPCALAGIPDHVAFRYAGVPNGITADPLGTGSPTTFEPGRPVHFEIAVPQKPDVPPSAADEVGFELPGIPGTGAAQGFMLVQNTATQVGPIEPGA